MFFFWIPNNCFFWIPHKWFFSEFLTIGFFLNSWLMVFFWIPDYCFFSEFLTNVLFWIPDSWTFYQKYWTLSQQFLNFHIKIEPVIDGADATVCVCFLGQIWCTIYGYSDYIWDSVGTTYLGQCGDHCHWPFLIITLLSFKGTMTWDFWPLIFC